MTILKSLEALHDLLNEEMTAVEKLIVDRMKSNYAPRIPEITSHLITAGGKKLRPLLCLSSAKLFGYKGNDHIKLAATVEFIHTATLLHDDVVDESNRRRGRETANILWDNKSSILVGDFLFSRSFQLMVETRSLDILKILATTAAEIAEGEVLQLTETNNLNLTYENYMKIIHGKTAVLFAAACETGAILAEADRDQIAAMKNYGNFLGISFQLVDDYLDYTGSSKKMGKNIGDDFHNGKITHPLIKTLEQCSNDEKLFFKRTITQQIQTQTDLQKALNIMSKYNSLESTKNSAIFWAKKAKDSLKILPANEVRQALINLADYTVSRTL